MTLAAAHLTLKLPIHRCASNRAWDPFDRSIDIRISRIRRKIEPNPEKPEVIRTVRGIGYVYDPR
jgi:DNA-binding response OmpR family regulator